MMVLHQTDAVRDTVTLRQLVKDKRIDVYEGMIKSTLVKTTKRQQDYSKTKPKTNEEKLSFSKNLILRSSRYFNI